MTTVAECYAELTNPFGVKAPYYTRPQGHSGADYAASRGDAVVAYEEFVVTTVQWSSYIGWCVEGRGTSGDFIGWAHLLDIAVRVGQRVMIGQTFARVAGAGDRPGNTWFGSHIHTTRSRQSGGIFSGPTYDPVPYINAAKGSSPAGGGELITIEQEDDMEPDSFYFRDATNPGRAYGRFNASTGKARAISKEEWEMRKALASTAGSTAPLPALTPVSASWYDRVFAL